MEVNSNEYYKYSGITDIDETYAAKACLYDSSKTFLSYINIKKTGDVVLIPSNAKYIRFSIKTSDGGENTFVFENNEKEIYVKNDNGVWEKFYREKSNTTKILNIFDETYGIRIKAYEREGVVQLLILTNNILTDIAAGQISYKLAILPEGARPLEDFTQQVQTSTNKRFQIQVQSNGNVIFHYNYVAITGNNNEQIRANLVFLCA